MENLNTNIIRQWQNEIALGNYTAFRKLFDCYAQKLTQFAFSITHNKEAAVDILDEVFIKVWKNRQSVPQIANLKTYLYTAIKNTALNYLARKASEQVTEPFDFVNINLSSAETPEQHLISAEILKKINMAVDALPPRCKMIFKLVREDGLKYSEVAEILNISIHTVDAQMVNAVKKISESVRVHFDAFPQKATSKK